MSLLYGAMLAGLAALAVPTVLHLIARQRFKVVDLPTIRLLDAQKRSNTLARRLVDRWQLLLRLLLLLLAVLAMARWYAAWSPGPDAPRNLVLVIDTSASMGMRQGGGGADAGSTAFDLARGAALTLVDGLPAGSRCGLVADAAAGAADLSPTTDLAAVRRGVAALAVIDGGGRGLVRAVADACTLLHGRRSVASQVVVLSDLRASAFAARDRNAMERIAADSAALGPALDLAFVDAGAPAGNVGIVDTHVRGGEAKIGEDAHIIATIVSSGDEPRDANLRLVVGGRKEPKAHRVTIPPHARTEVDLTTRVNRSAQMLAQVEIDADDYPADDTRAVPLNVRDVRRVLLVDGAETAPVASVPGAAPAPGAGQPGAGQPARGLNGATILRYAFNPGRELGLPYGTGFETTAVTVDALAAQPLSSFEMVVLYDVSGLPERLIGDLRSFVQQGRALLIVASGATSAVAFNRSLAAGTAGAPPLAPAQIGNDRELDPAVGIAPDGGDRTFLASFLDPAQGDLSVVRLLALREVRDPPPTTTVLLRATDGRPIAVQSALGAGQVGLLLTGFELSRGNLARTRVFPSLVWRLADHLTGRGRTRPGDDLQALRPAVLDVAEPALSLVEHLELTPAGAAADADGARPAAAGTAIPLPAATDGSVRVPPLAAGAYTLHRARPPGDSGALLGYQRYVTAHVDPNESAMDRIPADGLAPLFGSSARRIPSTALADLAPKGGELTLPLLILLAALYAIEAAAGWISGRRRERRAQREAEAA